MSKVRNLQTLLTSMCENTTGDTVSVGDLLNAVGRRSYGPVLMLLGFIAISPLTIIPGANWLIALVTLIFAVQLLIGKNFPWVPRKAIEFSFPRSALVKGVEIGSPWAGRIDKFLKPRLTFLTDPPFAQLVALVCIAAALITFPLGFVPFGPLLPGLTILLFGLGLTSRDGFVLILAGGALVGASYVMMRMWSALPFG